MKSFGVPDLHIGTQVRTKNGIILHDEHQIGHSWTYNGHMAAFAMITDAQGTTDATMPLGGLYTITGGYAKDTAGTFSRDDGGYANCGFQANDTSITKGIVVGTSDEPFHLYDSDLMETLTHGSGAGQITYNAQANPVITWDGVTYQYKIQYSRVFNNNTAAEITVKEIGMMYYGYDMLSGRLMTRDVLDTPVVVPIGSQLTVTVEMTSASLQTEFENVKIADDYEVGDQVFGGTFLGHTLSVNSSIPVKYKHFKYGYILSPKVGGEFYGLAMDTTNTLPPSSVGNYYGQDAMDYFYGLGANSPMAQACADANTNNLGGFNDWYIPGFSEADYFYNFQGDLTSIGEEFVNNYYWVVGYNSNSSQLRVLNMSNNSYHSYTYPNQTNRDLRLIRIANVATDTP